MVPKESMMMGRSGKDTGAQKSSSRTIREDGEGQGAG